MHEDVAVRIGVEPAVALASVRDADQLVADPCRAAGVAALEELGPDSSPNDTGVPRSFA
jgi:hypothetical protein